MKIITIAAALSIGLASALSASPRGKHPVDFADNSHGMSVAPKAQVKQVHLKHVGPPGKGVFRACPGQGL